MISWKQVLQHTTAWLSEYVWRMFGAFVLLTAGLLVATAINFYFRRVLRKNRDFELRKKYFAIRGILTLAVLAATATLMLVALGVAGPVVGFVVTVGIALGIFADSLAGFRILLLEPFQIGDKIELKGEGLTGVVTETTLTGIVLTTPSRAQVILSNRKLFDNPIINHTPAGADSLLSFQFVLELPTDISALEEQICSLAAAMPGFHHGSGGTVRITRIESDTVTCSIQFFVSTRSPNDLSTEFLKSAKVEFDRRNVKVRSLETLKS
jgi:small conductance mechanosensitive channel